MNYRIIILLFAIFLISASSVHTQQMWVVGSGEFLESELVASEHRNINGDVCAGLIIISELAGLTFNSYNGIVKLNHKPGKDFLFLSPDERVVEVYKRGYTPLKIILSEYDIKLKSGEVWQLRVKGDRVQTANGKGRFLITSEPEGAQITIDGIPTFNERTPFLLENFNAQQYLITLIRDEYDITDTSIIIQKDKYGEVNIRLTPKFGYFAVESQQSGLELNVNGSSLTFSNNIPIKIPVGRKKIRVSREYFNDYDTEIFINPNDNPSNCIPINVNLQPIISSINIDSNPQNASVYLNDEYIGTTPVRKIIEAGRYNLRVEKEQYRVEKRNFDLYSEIMYHENIHLSKKGKVNIIGTRGAIVFINGNKVGEIPINDLFLDPGKYKVKVLEDFHDTEEENVTIETGEIELEYNLNLTKGKFLRIGGFGNERLSDIMDGWGIYFIHQRITVHKNWVETMTPRSKELKYNLLGGGISYQSHPLSINCDLQVGYNGLNDFTDLTMDSLNIITTKLELNWIPFVLFEEIYPFGGVNYTYNVYTYKNNGSFINEKKKGYTGYQLGIEWKPSIFLLTAGYYNLIDKTDYEGFYFIHVGFWFPSIKN